MQKEEIKSRISRVLSELAVHTGYGGVYYPMDSAESLRVGERTCSFCAGCLGDTRAGGFCRNTVCTSAVQGYAVGSAWFFRCWLGLDSFAVPIAPSSGGEIIGVIEVGGFIQPGQSHGTREIALSRLSSVDALDLFQIHFGALQEIVESGDSEIAAVAEFLLEATFAAGLNSASFFAMRRRVNEQQQRLAAKVQELEPSAPRLPETLTTLGELLQLMHEGDLHRARIRLDDFLGQMLLSSGQNLENARSHLLILLSVLACDKTLNVGNWQSFSQRFAAQIIELNRMSDLESLCYWAESLVLKHHESIVDTEHEAARESSFSERILGYLSRNYMKKLSLQDAAKTLGASPSSIVHGLKAETGRTFVEHLTSIRIREAKSLLAYSNQSLGEISRQCGFKDQSYFTKVFRQEINLTPREFRKMLLDNLNSDGDETPGIAKKDNLF